MSNKSNKYENIENIASECKRYVRTIETYTGTDPLAPWYEYLLWIEENFVIDFKCETIFDDLLAACLCQFEHSNHYKQDRRLIKLFIKFIHFQDQQNMHYEAMLANGFGSKVADLYINWAFHFDVNEDFAKAEAIYRRGLKEKAEPLHLLEAAHRAFRYSMSQRVLYKSDETFQREQQKRMIDQLEAIASLRIDGNCTTTVKSKTLQRIDKDKLKNVCIPNLETGNQTPEQKAKTPEKRQTSIAKNIIDSARKMRHEKRKLNAKACRLDFNDNACSESPSPEDLYSKGIQLYRNFKSKNRPQTQPPPIAYSDPAIGQYRGELPGYDKIMLVPANNVAFSPDELKAYNWFKQKGITNAFTREQDKLWAIGYDVPIRWSEVFAKKNQPQSEWNVPRISPTDELNEKGSHEFMCRITEIYPKHSIEEFSLDEIMWNKRKASAAMANSQPKNQINKTTMKLNRTNSCDSKLSPIIEMELSGFEDALIEVPQRRRDSIHPSATAIQTNKKRKSSILPTFDALNDTCTTQMFSNLLHSTVISTPKVKIPKFNDEVDAVNWQEETKLKLFTDQSSSELLADMNKEKCSKNNNQPNDFGFAIYEDRTATIHAIRNAACRDIINDLTIGNKENIALTMNQLSNLEQTKLSNKSELKRSTVMNLTNDMGTKQQFQFDIYTDETQAVMKLLEDANKEFDRQLSSVENKENIIEPAHSNPTKPNVSIEEKIAQVNKMIESVLNGTNLNGANIIKTEAIRFNDSKNEVNLTKNLNEPSMFKTPLLLPQKIELVSKPFEKTYNDILDTTEEFELLEAQCAKSPNFNCQSIDVQSKHLERSFAKNVTISEANKSKYVDNTTLRFSIQLTEEERKNVLNNSSVNDRTRLNWTQQPSNEFIEKKSATEFDDNEDDDAENEIGQSIYVKQPELEFNEKDADWKEVTQFLTERNSTNEYKVEEVMLDETRHRMDTITHIMNLKDLNPFDPDLQKDVLNAIGFMDHLNGANNFNCTMMNIVQPLKPSKMFEVNKRKFQVKKLIGSGAFGKVFAAECIKTKEMYAFKQQRPPNLWEYYVCLEIHSRIIDESVRNGFMAVDFAVIGNNATIFASKFSKYGTILSVCNKIKDVTNKNIDECIVMILVKQMFTIMEHFHNAKFIHADIKPDNFLLMDKLSLNYENPDIVMQLIDFGQSIDLNYFKKQVFWAKVKTQNFICTQMMEDKPWTYHCDLFCLASTIYTMVAGKYMVVSRCKPTDPYKPQKLPRYVNGSMWNQIFDTLINTPNNSYSLAKMPSFSQLHQLLDNELRALGPKKVTEAIIKFNKALD